MAQAPRDLDACYERCRLLTKRHGATYYFSANFFPKAIRRSIHGLYGFVRVPDDLVDRPIDGRPEAAARRAGLERWQNEFELGLERGWSHEPVLNAFIDTVRRHSIPVEYPRAFMASMLMDLCVRRYQTFAELCEYTYGSASVIGLMICAIVGVRDPAVLPYAADLGLAMQLTNFLRDIGEDYVERGRIYVPIEDLCRFGYAEADLAAGRVDGRLRALLGFEIGRTRAIYRNAEHGIAALPPYAQFPVRLAGTLYAAILGRIEANNYDVFAKRARTSKAFKLRTAASLWAAQRLGLPSDMVP